MNDDPHTFEEWSTYIDGLEPDRIYERVERANSVTFVRALREDGLGPKEIRGVFECFVRRIVANDELPPAGGYYDLRRMMDELGLATQASG